MLIDAVKPFCHDKCIELGNIAKIYISILRLFFSNTNTQYVAIREMEIKSHVNDANFSLLALYNNWIF